MEAELFAAALGLQKPWHVSELEFPVSKKRLDINIDFEAGGLFPCPTCGVPSKAYDSTSSSWRHLDFFNMKPTSTLESHELSVPRGAAQNG